MTLQIEVMSAGTWNGIKFTIDDLKAMAGNFAKLKEVIKPPIKLGHSADKVGDPALGWISDLKVVGRKLMAYADDIPEILMNAIKKKLYRRVSCEVFFDYKYDGKEYGKVFSALAFLGAETPAVKDLEDLQAYLTQNTENGTFGKLMVFSRPNQTDNNKSKKGNVEMDKEIQAKLDAFSDKLNTVSEENAGLKAENKKLKAKQKETEAKAFKDLKEKTKGDLKSFCDAQVKEGKMLPAQRDALIGEVCFSDSGDVVIEFSQFKDYVKLAEKVLDKKQSAQDKGNDKENFTDVQDEVDRKVKKFMAEKGEKDYTIAMDAVLDADKDLADRYSDDYAIGKEA